MRSSFIRADIIWKDVKHKSNVNAVFAISTVQQDLEASPSPAHPGAVSLQRRFTSLAIALRAFMTATENPFGIDVPSQIHAPWCPEHWKVTVGKNSRQKTTPLNQCLLLKFNFIAETPGIPTDGENSVSSKVIIKTLLLFLLHCLFLDCWKLSICSCRFTLNMVQPHGGLQDSPMKIALNGLFSSGFLLDLANASTRNQR